MADKFSDLSGDEREQRIAELKRKMQEAAKRRATSGSTDAMAVETPVTAPAPEPRAAVDDAVAEPAEAPIHEAAAAVVAVKEEAPAAVVAPAPRPAPAKPSPNGSRPQAVSEAQGPTKSEMNRREFFTYAWAGALGLLALEGAVLSYQFMMPRFKAGEFGGLFTVGPVSALPASDAAPQPNPDGKFWLVTTEDSSPKALYMVCTHLGCLYQWVEANFRFECPCHGSKFTHDGFYIEGPAPRSLDSFETEVVDGILVVDTGARIKGDPSGDSPAAASA